jgi:hypothetical protein
MTHDFTYELRISGTTPAGLVSYDVFGQQGVHESVLGDTDMLELGSQGDLKIIVPVGKLHKIVPTAEVEPLKVNITVTGLANGNAHSITGVSTATSPDKTEIERIVGLIDKLKASLLDII